MPIEAMMQYTRHDHFDTPEYAVDSLVPFLNEDWVIWEPTDTYGRSGITTGLQKAGFTVEATNFDFLTSNVEDGFDCIITNPPYTKKDAFIEKCIWYNCPFALLMPLTALEGQRRYKSWSSIEQDFGLIVHDKRIDFTGGGVWFNTSWYTYLIYKGVHFHHVP